MIFVCMFQEILLILYYDVWILKFEANFKKRSLYQGIESNSIVFTFPRFCSIFCVDNSQIFWCSHKYLWSIRFIPHSFWDICEGSEFFSHTFVYLCVYRHANLCSGLRAILSPQFIKKSCKFWAYFRGRGTAAERFEPTPLGPDTDAL